MSEELRLVMMRQTQLKKEAIAAKQRGDLKAAKGEWTNPPIGPLKYFLFRIFDSRPSNGPNGSFVENI